jgi:uncharacterized membrane protein YbhN (UPF0104 family)
MSGVAHFFQSFGSAFSHLVVWAFLLGVLAALARTAVQARAWQNLLTASFPNAKVRWRDAYGAYLVKNGAGVLLPMHGDDAVRVALMRDRIEGASPAAIAATAGVETLVDMVGTAALVGLSAWLGASVVDWQEIAAHPARPALVLALVFGAIGTALVAVRRRARTLGDDLKQGLLIFRRRGEYSRRVLVWQLIDFGLQLATLYFLLVAFGFAGPSFTSLILIRTAQRVTVSLPGFLETGSQQAMIIAILTSGGHTAGEAFGFGFGMKVTLSGLNIGLALVAARIMIGPLHLGDRIARRVHPPEDSLPTELGSPPLARGEAEIAGTGGVPSSSP